MQKRNTRGITLIELIVVMAIMAILSSIAVISINSVIKKNEYEANVGKIRSAIDTCVTATESLNQGVGTVAGVEYIALGDLITPENFKGMISDSIPSGYNIKVVGSAIAPTETASGKDLVIIYVEGVGTETLKRGNSLNPSQNTNVVVRGGWYVPVGETAAITFIQSDREAYKEAKDIS